MAPSDGGRSRARLPVVVSSNVTDRTAGRCCRWASLSVAQGRLPRSAARRHADCSAVPAFNHDRLSVLDRNPGFMRLIPAQAVGLPMSTADDHPSPGHGTPPAASAFPRDVHAVGPDSEVGRIVHLQHSMAGLPPGDVARWLEDIRIQIQGGLSRAMRAFRIDLAPRRPEEVAPDLCPTGLPVTPPNALGSDQDCYDGGVTGGPTRKTPAVCPKNRERATRVAGQRSAYKRRGLHAQEDRVSCAGT
jgi:hypothetical protein